MDPEKYPKLFQSCKKHPAVYRDSQGSNCLLLATQSGETEIVKLVIEAVDAKVLKSETIIGNKTIFSLLTDMVNDGNMNFAEILNLLAVKTNQKSPKKEKKERQRLICLGKNMIFEFRSNDKKIWKCIQDGCASRVQTDEHLMLTDNNHYIRLFYLFLFLLTLMNSILGTNALHN